MNISVRKYQSNFRSIFWVVTFFFILAVFLFPLILLSQHYNFELSIGIQAVLLVVVTMICQRLRKASVFEITGYINRRWLAQFAIGLLVGIGLMGVPALILLSTGDVRFVISELSIHALLSGFLMCLSVALAEELLFRGFIFQRLIHATGPFLAQLIIAALFVLTHFNNPGMSGTIQILAGTNIFIASILFGLAFIKTKSLALPIGIHLMANFFQGTIMGFGVSGNHEESLFDPMFIKGSNWFNGGQFGIEASVPGLLVLIITIVTVFYFPFKTAKSVV